MKLTKKQILFLAAEWNKDIRTIQRWAKHNNPMLSHPQSIKVIESAKELKTA